MEAPASSYKARGGGADPINGHVNWYLWRPCAGIEGVCPPLARWAEMTDGTYDLVDIKMMHCVMDEKLHQLEVARNG